MNDRKIKIQVKKRSPNDNLVSKKFVFPAQIIARMSEFLQEGRGSGQQGVFVHQCVEQILNVLDGDFSYIPLLEVTRKDTSYADYLEQWALGFESLATAFREEKARWQNK